MQIMDLCLYMDMDMDSYALIYRDSSIIGVVYLNLNPLNNLYI